LKLVAHPARRRVANSKSNVVCSSWVAVCTTKVLWVSLASCSQVKVSFGNTRHEYSNVLISLFHFVLVLGVLGTVVVNLTL
jgi:hypothetical protein